LRARALYEGGVVPVRAVARLCGVSLRTLYNYVHKYGWRRRRADEPRDKAKAERQRRRYQARKASRPQALRGLKARDPQGQARALAAVDRAAALSGVALTRALARRDAEADARTLAILVRTLRELAAIEGAGEAAARKPDNGADVTRRELKRRIETLMRDRAARPPQPLPEPMPAQSAPPPTPYDDEPLSEQDRRINAIAARFYARRE